MLRGYKEEIEADPMAFAALENGIALVVALLTIKENIHRISGFFDSFFKGILFFVDFSFIIMTWRS